MNKTFEDKILGLDKVIIRKYQAQDRQAIRKLCCDTAYFGDPCEEFFPDRELLADLIMNYYTDYEPEHTWVAEYRDDIIGYLCAGISEARYNYLVTLKVLPFSFLKAFARRKIWDIRTSRLIKYNVRSFFTKEVVLKKADCKKYSVHIHQNIKQGFRGKGIGSELVEAMLKEIKDKASGIRFRALRQKPGFFFFEKYGFKKIDCRRVKTWEKWLGKSPLYFMEYEKSFHG